MHVDIERIRNAIERVEWRNGNAAPPELHVVFGYVDPSGRFRRTDVCFLHRAVKARGHCSPQDIVFVTAFKVSDGLGMSAHFCFNSLDYIFAVQRRLIFAQLRIIRSKDDASVTRSGDRAAL
ncbi:hypothetical protein [Caballeronia sp. Lep1P3]|uniref:hypothetical protein n=1 Tax=Caballeronia sp. Lep1P3 TaxID=2878150 RepID=UPI001FCF81CC|nr:hypothetical protein [Caballeronia sp. Lep1P3]